MGGCGDSMCELPLSDGSTTRVDPEDWWELYKYRWDHAKNGYAVGRMATQYEREHQRGPRVGGAQKQVALHRLIAGAEAGQQVDHINQDKLDNRRANRQAWQAYAGLDGRRHHLGYYSSEDEAAQAASQWRAENMPFSEDALALQEVC